MIVKKEKKSTQYNQFKLRDHEQSAQKALVTSSSQSYAHSSHCVQEMRFIQNRVRCISNTLVALIRNLTISLLARLCCVHSKYITEVFYHYVEAMACQMKIQFNGRHTIPE